jgi:hypothetical protein
MKKILSLLVIALSLQVAHAQVQREPIRDFRQGLFTKVAKNLVPSGGCYFAENVLWDETLGIKTRDGYSVLSTTDCTKIFYFPKSNGEKYLIRQAEDRLYFSLDKGSNWTKIRNDMNSRYSNLQYAIFNDVIYFVNGIDYPFYFEGNQTYTNGLYYDEIQNKWLIGKHILADKNKLMIANTASQPNVIFVLIEGADPADEDNGWNPALYQPVGEKAITGMASHKNLITLVFNRDETWGLIGYGVQIDGVPTWSVSNISTIYGCPYIESLSDYKGYLTWLSKDGIVYYNGSEVREELDTNVENLFEDCNNLGGEYSRWSQNNTSDFDDGTASNINTEINELKLEEYEFIWENLTSGTFSNTEDKGSHIALSTTTQRVATKLDLRTSGFSTDIYSYASFNMRKFDLPEYYDNSTFIDYNPATAFTTGFGVEGRIISLDEGASGYNNEAFMYDRVEENTEFASSASELKNGAKDATIMTSQYSASDRYSILPYFVYNIPIYESEQGAYVERLEFSASSSLGRISYTGLYKPVSVQFYLRCVLYVEFEAPEYNATLPVVTIMRKGFDPTGANQYDEAIYNSSEDLKFNLFGGRRVTNLKLIFFIDDDISGWQTMAGFPFNVSITCPVSISPVRDVTVYYRDTDHVYNSSGWFVSDSTRMATNNIKWGNAYVDSEYDSSAADYDVYGTSLTVGIQSSTDGSTWSSFQILTSTIQPITVPDGQYMRFSSTYTTKFTTQTPKLFSVTVEGRQSTGTWISKQYNIGKCDGGWSYFIADDVTYTGDAISYFAKMATASASLDDQQWESISSGELLSGLTSGTTSNTWIQMKSSFTLNSGTNTPTCRSMVASYASESIPITPVGTNLNGRYLIGIATESTTANDIVMVLDKNTSWTKFTYNVVDFCDYGYSKLFTNSSAVYELDSGTTDAGTDIVSVVKRCIPFNCYTFDKWLMKIFTAGLYQSSGSLQVKYTEENASTEYGTDNIDYGTANQRFRHEQPVNKSAVQDFTIVHRSTSSPYEIHAIDLWYETKKEF